MKIMNKKAGRKSAQDIQDDIFRKMSPSKKMEVAALLWRLGKNLSSDKIDYAKYRSDPSLGKYRQSVR